MYYSESEIGDWLEISTETLGFDLFLFKSFTWAISSLGSAFFLYKFLNLSLISTDVRNGSKGYSRTMLFHSPIPNFSTPAMINWTSSSENGCLPVGFVFLCETVLWLEFGVLVLVLLRAKRMGKLVIN